MLDLKKIIRHCFITLGHPVVKLPAANYIILSERGFETSGSAVEHQCYPGMSRPEQWKEDIAEKRHDERPNRLYLDGHAASGKLQETIGDGTETRNRHFVLEWLDHYTEGAHH